MEVLYILTIIFFTILLIESTTYFMLKKEASTGYKIKSLFLSCLCAFIFGASLLFLGFVFMMVFSFYN